MSESVKTAATDRDDRQEQVRDWVVRCWGEGAVSVNERVERFFEEAAELAQAEGVPPSRLTEIIQHVYRKDPGEPSQEVGGIGTTLLAYCAAKGVSADACERRELSRILAKPVEHFRARHAAKVASGLAQVILPKGWRLVSVYPFKAKWEYCIERHDFARCAGGGATREDALSEAVKAANQHDARQPARQASPASLTPEA